MLMRLIRRVLTAILLMLAFGVTGSLGEVRQFKTLTGRDGLSDILVNTIYKDYQGYIWLGTESAVDRYDGNSIVSYSDRQIQGPGSRQRHTAHQAGRPVYRHHVGPERHAGRHRAAQTHAGRQDKYAGQRPGPRPLRQHIHRH